MVGASGSWTKALEENAAGPQEALVPAAVHWLLRMSVYFMHPSLLQVATDH